MSDTATENNTIVITRAEREAGKIKLIQEYKFRNNLANVTFAHKAPGEYSFMRDENGNIIGIQLVKEPEPMDVREAYSKNMMKDEDPSNLPSLGTSGPETLNLK